MAASRSRACTAAYFAVAGETSRPLQLGYEAVLNGRAVVHRLACELPAISADLIEVAATVYAVDRLVPRPATRDMSAGLSWARELRLGIPVREPQLWSAHARQLTELLAWLTDDTWSLEFFQFAGGTGLLDEPQAFLFHTIPQGAAPALFSGGLDSAAGPAAEHGVAAHVRTAALPGQPARPQRGVQPAIPRTAIPRRWHRDRMGPAPGPAAGLRKRHRRYQLALPAIPVRLPGDPGNAPADLAPGPGPGGRHQPPAVPHRRADPDRNQGPPHPERSGGG